MNLAQIITNYYELRGLKWPTAEEAMMWAETEMGEVYEILLAQKGGWVRNNPEDHTASSADELGTELGDVIMMLMVAGIVQGTDPITCLTNKMERKIREHGVE